MARVTVLEMQLGTNPKEYKPAGLGGKPSEFWSVNIETPIQHKCNGYKTRVSSRDLARIINKNFSVHPICAKNIKRSTSDWHAWGELWDITANDGSVVGFIALNHPWD